MDPATDSSTETGPVPVAPDRVNEPSLSVGDGLRSEMVDAPRSRIIVADFVDALVQLPGIAPDEVSLRIIAPQTRFGVLLIGDLHTAGYDMRLIASAAPGMLEYLVTPNETAADRSGTYTFLLSAEAIKLKRAYRVDGEGVQPASPMFVHGAPAEGVTLDTSRFDPARLRQAIAAADRIDSVRSGTSGQTEIAFSTQVPVQVQSIQTTPTEVSDRFVAGADAGSEAGSEAGSSARVGRASDQTPPNFSETGESFYAPILSAYTTFGSYTMEFDNDSMFMGNVNKRVAMDIVQRFDTSRDLISLIGCSHGRTALAGGNKALAIGRADRVKEEFVRAGIDADKMLDEGCWANTYHDKMPRRGVVVSHQRLAE